jgi:hypothetical protein
MGGDARRAEGRREAGREGRHHLGNGGGRVILVCHFQNLWEFSMNEIIR